MFRVFRLIGLVLLFSWFPLNLAANSCATTVPYSWSFTTNPFSVASVFVENDGPAFNTESNSDTFSGSFKIKRNFVPPNGGWVLAPGEVIPNTTNFTCKAFFDGTYANSTLEIAIGNVGFKTHVKANASVKCLDVGEFSPVEHGTGSGPLADQSKVSTPKVVNDGDTISFSGDIDVETLFGFGGPNLDFIKVFAQVRVEGDIDKQQKNIKYHKPDGTACDDGNPDTTNDRCQNGECHGDGNGNLVVLYTLTAFSVKNGIRLDWETAAEPDSIGFFLWRAISIDGECSYNSSNYIDIVRLKELGNPVFIDSTGDSTNGAVYSYVDEEAEQNVSYCYVLEDVNDAGNSTYYLNNIVGITRP